MADKALSHAEVWDDSALQESWNAAQAEYKKYHSLAVKGEKVVLNAPSSDQETSIPNGDSPVKTGSKAEAEAVAELPSVDQEMPAQSQPGGSMKASINPPAILANVQDADLKNLMMSWYYAGYYTGLYEGKQQGYASASQREEE